MRRIGKGQEFALESKRPKREGTGKKGREKREPPRDIVKFPGHTFGLGPHLFEKKESMEFFFS